MSVQVKICGINSVEAADAAMRAGADYGGLVFHASSPRRLSFESASALADRMRGRLRLVALLCDALDDQIARVIAATKPELLQLHGDETPERVATIRSKFGIPVIKAVAIADLSDLSLVPAYESVGDMLLFDSKTAADARRPGGSGIAFDWCMLRGRTFSCPWLLAGGLTPENVDRAIRLSGAPGVDVSSGVETSPGRKSTAMISAFIAHARAASLADGGHA